MFQRFFILFILFSLYACSKQVETETDLIKAINNNQTLQAEKNICPLDIALQDKTVNRDGSVDPNFSKRLIYHYSQCIEQQSPNSCYNLGLGLEKHGFEDESQVIFQRACRMGIASGCTNRAAGIKNAGISDEKTAQCITRTFAKTCEWKDPWGCSMYSQQLLLGEGVRQSNQMALAVLKGSCRFGEDDPACQAAHSLKAYIYENARPSKPSK